MMGAGMPSSLQLKHFLTAAVVVAGIAARAGAAPTVAGLDFCADQYVLAFADRQDIVAVSGDATSPNSFYLRRAQGLHALRGGAEEVLMLRPDILVRSYRGSLSMDAKFERVGITSYQPPYAFNFEANLKNFGAVATLLGHEAEGKAFMADYMARYQALKQAAPIPMKTVYMTPSGFTAGKGSSVDDMIRLAGLDPIAEDLGLNGWGPLPLEQLVMMPPDLVVGSFFEEGAVHISNWSSGRHTVFRDLVKDVPSIMVPSGMMSCGGAFTVDAAEYIRSEIKRRELMPNRVAAAATGEKQE
jgi:iron complex transport system substrate-binding protein